MRVRQVAVLGAALLMPLLGLAPIVLAQGRPAAPAKPPPARPGDAGAKFDPQNQVAISQAMASVVQGMARFKDKDIPGATAAFEHAMKLNPRLVLAPVLLAEVQMSSGKLTEAAASLQTADGLTSAQDPQMRGRVLFLKADVLERQKKWPEAKAAWQTYAEHCAKNADAGLFPASAEARLKALDKAMAQDKAYDIVRKRIEEEKDGGADASRPAPKK